MAHQPLFVIIPGSWHPDTAYSHLARAIEALGYQTRTLLNPSVATSDPSQSLATDQEAAREKIEALLDEGKDLVLVPHSYGGAVTFGAASGLSKAERQAAGKKGGVLAIIGISTLLPKGPCFDSPEQRAPWVLRDTPSEGLCFVTDIYETFFADVPKDLAEEVMPSLKPISDATFLGKPAYDPVWTGNAFDKRLGYIRCANDVAIPLQFQDFFLQSSGKELVTREMQTSHSPFLSQPAETAKVIMEIFEEMQAKA